MGRFDGKTAVVTGAASGIGRAIAARLVADGATVVVTDVSEDRDSVAEELGDRAVARRLDVSDPADVDALEDWLREEFGGLDLLANNAGIGGGPGDFHELSLESFDQVMGVNARGAFMVLRAGLRLMLESGGGAVVNTASLGGFRATPAYAPYMMSKGASVMMTRVAALEYANQGIRVNAVAPGPTRTPIYDAASEELMAELSVLIPQGRFGEPEEIAGVATFLLDDVDAGHVTGQIWVVDGGRTAG